MPEPFTPKQPEKMIEVLVSAREAHLLKVLRKYNFGKFTIHKMNGLVIRIEANESQLLNEKEGLDLAIKYLVE